MTCYNAFMYTVNYLCRLKCITVYLKHESNKVVFFFIIENCTFLFILLVCKKHIMLGIYYIHTFLCKKKNNGTEYR